MAKDESVDQEICPKCEQELCQCSLGEKRVCPACETRFYDLNTRSKKPKCPQCGEVYTPDDVANTTLKTKSELEAEGGVSDDVVTDDYVSDDVDDNVKDDTDLDDEAEEEDGDVDVIPATDEVELKIEDDDEEDGGAKPRKKYSDVSIGDELDTDIMDADDDDEEDIELDGNGTVPK